MSPESLEYMKTESRNPEAFLYGYLAGKYYEPTYKGRMKFLQDTLNGSLPKEFEDELQELSKQ